MNEQVRRETAAKVLTSLVQRDGDARRTLITSGALRSVLELLNPTGRRTLRLPVAIEGLRGTMEMDSQNGH